MRCAHRGPHWFKRRSGASACTPPTRKARGAPVRGVQGRLHFWSVGVKPAIRLKYAMRAASSARSVWRNASSTELETAKNPCRVIKTLSARLSAPATAFASSALPGRSYAATATSRSDSRAPTVSRGKTALHLDQTTQNVGCVCSATLMS